MGSNMARVCKITGKRPFVGGSISRSGKAKKDGGIGRHVTRQQADICPEPAARENH